MHFTVRSSLQLWFLEVLISAYIFLDIDESQNGAPITIPTIQRPARRLPTDMDLLMRLDSFVQTGLTDVELRRLMKKLVRCRCGLVMTQRVFGGHQCMNVGEAQSDAPASQAVIDLTNDDSE